ncbi:MAG TPA: CBS domain-containing protein [Anaerolineae bacterium]|nr:CBS domain-containing protein [Anaerolineae bacterium]
MKQELVRDWMSSPPITIDVHATLPEACEIMRKHKIRRLPVMQEGKLVGIVTRGDLRGAQPSEATSLSIWELNYLLAKLKMKEIMTPDPITIRDDATIRDAAQLMIDYKVSGLPVVDKDGNLVGMITESDIFRLVVKHWREEEEGKEEKEFQPA